MNRSESRTEMRRRAARAFSNRNRLALSLEAVREAEPGETALSRSEIAYGVRVGLIAASSAPAREAEVRTAVRAEGALSGYGGPREQSQTSALAKPYFGAPA